MITRLSLPLPGRRSPNATPPGENDSSPGTENGAIPRGGQLRMGTEDYSFTPPTATPAMMYLLRAKYTISRGSAVRVRPR